MAGPTAGRILNFGTGLENVSPSVVMQSDYKFLGFLNSSPSISDNTLTTLSIEAEIYKTGITHSNVTNPSRITFTTVGYYWFYFSIAAASNGQTGGTVLTQYKINGSTQTLYLSIDACPLAGKGVIVTGGIALSFAANDYLELATLQISGAARTLTGGSSFIGAFLMPGWA